MKPQLPFVPNSKCSSIDYMGEDEKQRGGRYCEMIQEEGPNVSGLLMD